MLQQVAADPLQKAAAEVSSAFSARFEFLTLSKKQHDIIPGRGVLRISLTPVCNLRCSHCYNEGRSKPWLHRASTAAAIHDLDSLIRAAAVRGVKTVRFTGGEPGMYPHFYELISATRTWGSTLASIDKWVLTTNGIPLSEAAKSFCAGRT